MEIAYTLIKILFFFFLSWTDVDNKDYVNSQIANVLKSIMQSP